MVVRRLIFATTDPVEELEFRAEEGVVLSGWDGLVSASEGSTYVPRGESRWELSTSEDSPRRAKENYAKRTKDPLGADPSRSTFVFATPRRWPNKERWIEEKRAEAIWGDVRAYDADTLHAWLEQAPAVHIWLSRHMGKQPPDAIDLETYWEDWSGVTNPPFSVPLVIGGRQAEASRLLEWISGVSTLISLQAETESKRRLHSSLPQSRVCQPMIETASSRDPPL